MKNIVPLQKRRIDRLVLDFTEDPWQRALENPQHYMLSEWPEGTVMVEQVKLLKEIPQV